MEKSDNATYDWPTPAMRANAARSLRPELLRAAMLTARSILADVNGGAVDDDRAETITRVGNAFQILDMAIEDDDKLAGPTGVVFDLPPFRMRREVTVEQGRVRVAVTAGPSDPSDEAERKRRAAYVEYGDDFPIGTPDQIPAERPDPYRWVDRLADKAGVVGGQGRSGGEMVASAIILLIGAALIAGVIVAAWVESWGN